MATHDEVVAFLSTAGVVGPGVPQLYMTHIALVFVAGGRALKIKRPVKFDFLDFSTLSLRHEACLSEISVNRDNAPQIYKGVVAITRGAGGTLSIGGAGEPVEWAVEMAAFEEDDLLSQRARQGPLDAVMMRQTGDAIYAMHLRSVPNQAIDAPSKMRSIIDEVGAICGKPNDVLSPAGVDNFMRAAHAACTTSANQLQARVLQGAYRRCHGDLHLANIVIWKGKPTLFDALEFSDEMATVDTLYDLAFLLMDLIHHQQRVAANIVLNRYLWRSGGVSGATDDIEALALMPLYIACRAGIRAMIGATRVETKSLRENEQQSMTSDSRRYLQEAISALVPRSPRLIAVGGLSGTGKSTLAAQLAPLLGGPFGALHIRSDLERKAMMGVEETERLAPEHYTQDAARLVYERVLNRAAAGIAAGQCVIVDAVFGSPDERASVAQVARKLSCPFDGIWLEADADLLRARVAGRSNDASDATREVVERQLHYTIGPLDWTVVDAGKSAQQTLADALHTLGIAAVKK